MLACKTSRQNQSQGRSRRYVYPRGADSTMIHRLSAAIQVRSETRSDKCASALIDSMVDRLTDCRRRRRRRRRRSTASIYSKHRSSFDPLPRPRLARLTPRLASCCAGPRRPLPDVLPVVGYESNDQVACSQFVVQVACSCCKFKLPPSRNPIIR